MKNSIRIASVALAAIVLVLTVAVLSPRHTRALGPMSVNPTSPRTPWHGSCGLVPVLGLAEASCQISDVPADAELVVQSEVFQAATTGPSSIEQVACVATDGGSYANVWDVSAKSPPHLIGGYYSMYVTSAVLFYADPGTPISCSSSVHDVSEFNSQQVSLQGYYVLPPSS